MAELERFVDCDLPCCRCGYNLRGLPLAHRCPECAHPIFESIAVDIFRVRDSLGRIIKTSTEATEQMAQFVGCSAGGVAFVYRAFFWTRHVIQMDRPLLKRLFTTSEMIDAERLCVGFHEYAWLIFKDMREAKKVLTEWGILRSEDVGRIISGLNAAGLIRNLKDEDVAAFVGLFRIEDWRDE